MACFAVAWRKAGFGIMFDDLVADEARAREEYAHDPAKFATDFTRQDAAILNVQRG